MRECIKQTMNTRYYLRMLGLPGNYISFKFMLSGVLLFFFLNPFGATANYEKDNEESWGVLKKESFIIAQPEGNKHGE